MITPNDKSTPKILLRRHDGALWDLTDSETGTLIGTILDDYGPPIVRAANTIDAVTAQRDALLIACKAGFKNLDADMSTMQLNRLDAQERERLCALHRNLEAAIALAEGGAK